MPPPTELLHQLRLRFQHDQHALGARGTKSTLDLVAAFLKGDVGEKEYALAAPAVELEYHRRSVAQAVEHVRLTRELAAPRRHHAELVPDVLDPRHAAARAAATIRFRRGFETRDDLGPLPHASRSAKLYMQQVALETNKTVLGAGRRTIHNSAIANKARWRRITDGNPCAFCAYQAALTAIYPDLNSGMVNYFHANCGCTVTEAYSRDLSPIEQERADLYERAYQACRDGGLSLTPKNIVAQMREHGHGIVHDATLPSDGSTPAEPGPKPAAGGAGGSGRKPPKTTTGGGGDGGPKRYEPEFHGRPGSRGDVRPPSVEVLMGHLAPAENKWMEFSPEERRTATWLAESLRIDLWSLKRRTGDGEVTPDALLIDLSASMELKTASTAQALVAQVRKGRKQSARLAVWSQLVDPAEVQRAVSVALGSYGDQLDELVVIFNDGASYVHWKHD